jgi:beta-galactosidase
LSAHNFPVFPYGAVYFRKSNPPGDEWERDYQQAASDGMNTFRHWFMWGAIETAPGVFDWDDYDRQLDLAAKYGITTIIGEVTHSAPEWAFHQYAHARFKKADGTHVESAVRNSSATGGFPGICLDNDDARMAAANFITRLATRYKDHPGMGGYDVWNECNLFSSAFPHCYCPGTAAKFQEWLQAKYGDLETLAKAWRRYSYTDWSQVVPPRGAAAYPENIDWACFRSENAHHLMKWRVDLIRSIDSIHRITAHGVYDASLKRTVDGADDPWLAASLVDSFGYTGGSSHTLKDDYRGHRWCFTDLHRGASNGKPYWSAELSAGPIWRDWGGQERGSRVPDGQDLIRASMVAMAGGVTGIMSNRWRPLLDGPLFGACAYYDMDGSVTDSSRAASRIAKWANAPSQEQLWKSRPIRGDIGILWTRETQIHSTLVMGKSDYYYNTVRGVYQGFLANNIQADWVHISQIDAYDLLYLPCPTLLNESTVKALIAWVEKGGKLVSEGCPGYFSDNGSAGTSQPNRGLDYMFGARQSYVEFTPDLMETEQVKFRIGDNDGIRAGLYLQAFDTVGGEATGWYEDGRVAAIDNHFGKGKTRLIGTVPGLGYWSEHSLASEKFFADILKWANKTQHVKCSETLLTARLHDGEGGTYLWAVNSELKSLEASLELSPQWGPSTQSQLLWGENEPEMDGFTLKITVPARDALVLKLD